MQDFARVRRELAGAARPRALVYYADFLGSGAVGWSALFVATRTNAAVQAIAVAVAALALWRAVYFIHEISHLRRGAVPGFTWVWNLVAGIPLGLPSLMIGAHKYHHQQATYGTDRDPEYAPIARWRWWHIAASVAEMVLVAPALALRWGVIAPLSLLSKRLRQLAVERASTLAINPRFRRPAPRGRERRVWIAQEIACAIWVWSIAALAIAGALALSSLAVFAAAITSAMVLNQIRTLVAHHYESDGEPMSMEAQTDDTITIGGVDLITDLVTPLGNRTHALHHWLPNIPYHQLPAIHRHLIAELPPDSVYRNGVRRGLCHALFRLRSRRVLASGRPASRPRAL